MIIVQGGWRAIPEKSCQLHSLESVIDSLTGIWESQALEIAEDPVNIVDRQAIEPAGPYLREIVARVYQTVALILPLRPPHASAMKINSLKLPRFIPKLFQ